MKKITVMITAILIVATFAVIFVSAQNWKIYTSENNYFSLIYPGRWNVSFSSTDENKTATFSGKQGYVSVTWGSGLGGACSQNLENFAIGKEIFSICHVFEGNKEKWYLISKILSPTVGIDISAAANAPANTNRKIILEVLQSLSFKTSK
jgi:hypothetical protein